VRRRRLVVFGLDCLWFRAGWDEVRHEPAEDVSESHSMGGGRGTANDISKAGRCGKSNGWKRGPSLDYIWSGSYESCAFRGAFVLVGAIPALGRRWRKAGLGATDMVQSVGGLGDAGETPVSASRINAENAQDFPQYCLKTLACHFFHRFQAKVGRKERGGCVSAAGRPGHARMCFRTKAIAFSNSTWPNSVRSLCPPHPAGRRRNGISERYFQAWLGAPPADRCKNATGNAPSRHRAWL